MLTVPTMKVMMMVEEFSPKKSITRSIPCSAAARGLPEDCNGSRESPTEQEVIVPHVTLNTDTRTSILSAARGGL